MTEFLLSLVLATTSSFMHDWSRYSILSQSRVPLYEKHRTVIYALGYMDYYKTWFSLLQFVSYNGYMILTNSSTSVALEKIRI